MVRIEHLIRTIPARPFGLPEEGLTENYPDWKQLLSGSAILVSQPDDTQVAILDIALSLAGINRYDAHTLHLWNVAAHSCLCDAMAYQDTLEAQAALDDEEDDDLTLHDDDEDVVLAGTNDSPEDISVVRQRLHETASLGPLNYIDLLLHDAPESITGDLTGPFTQGMELRLPGFMKAYKALDHEWEVAIYHALGLPLIGDGDGRHEIVKRYDIRALYVERDILMMKPPAHWVQENQNSGMAEAYPLAGRMIADFMGLPRVKVAQEWLLRLYTRLEELQATGDFDVTEGLEKTADALLRLECLVESGRAS